MDNFSSSLGILIETLLILLTFIRGSFIHFFHSSFNFEDDFTHKSWKKSLRRFESVGVIPGTGVYIPFAKALS